MFKRNKQPASQPAASPKGEHRAKSGGKGADTAVLEPAPSRRYHFFVETPLRITMNRKAYADITAHAKDALDCEVCGVLVGEANPDDEVPSVDVQAIIRGSATRQANTQVTFTQETWTQIHDTLEREYPRLKIVGWYHSHPGFGVEFSEMDLFIQENFFNAPTQIAFLTDPLGGAVAICCNSPKGIAPIDRFWVDGREQRCYLPERPRDHAAGERQGAAYSQHDLDALQTRLNQVLVAVDELRTTVSRILMSLFFFVCLGVLFLIGFVIYRSFTSSYEPPRVNSYIPFPVKIGDRLVYLGVGLVEWNVPDELKPAYLPPKKKASKGKQNQHPAAPPAAQPGPASDANGPTN